LKKILLSLLVLGSTIVYSQELDETYLNSLPDSVKKDIEEKLEAKEELEKPVYRRASSFVDKKKDLDKDNEDEDGTIIFASDFFDVMQTSFMPTNEPNLDPTYILDFGDVLEIQLVGQEDFIETAEIKRDGSISLPNIGRLTLSGLSLNDASSLIKTKVNNTYIGTDAYISLKNVRDINVLVVGNAYNPGIYTLNGNSNMLHALSMAGGINEIGSYRNISLVRSGKVIDTLDIYEVLIYGKYNFSNGLRSGDSIVVNPYGRLVSIESGVMRPAIFELKDDESFEDLLKFSNGFGKNNDFENIVVKRVANGESKIINLTLDELYSFNLLDNDSIFIREFKIDTVKIEGSINNPGTYKFTRGTTLSEAIISAGGYDSSAYVFGGYLENAKALQINEEAKERLYKSFITNLITNGISPASKDNSGIQALILQLKEMESTGRIIAEFDLDLISRDPSLDTILEDGDRLLIPQKTQQVYVQGEVANPGAIRYSPGKDINFYLERSGGVLQNGDLRNIFIVHPNGETENLGNKARLPFMAVNNKELIYPGSVIYIPQDTDFTNSMQKAAIWAPIISSIALSMTSLSVLNRSD